MVKYYNDTNVVWDGETNYTVKWWYNLYGEMVKQLFWLNGETT